jgi:hypothetical protein
MTEYAFVLGSNWLLSIAELLEYMVDRGMDAKLVDHSRNVAILEVPLSLDKDTIIDLQSALGGCFKIAKVLVKHDRESATKAYPRDGKSDRRAQSVLKNVSWASQIWPSPKSKRIRYGVSTYPILSGRSEGVNYRKFTQRMNEQLKKWLLDREARRADYYSYDEPDRRVSGRLNVALWPKSIQKNNLLTPPNAEIVAAFTEKRVYLCKTLIVYDSVPQRKSAQVRRSAGASSLSLVQGPEIPFWTHSAELVRCSWRLPCWA